MPVTPNVGLTYAEAGQAQKHITLNEALRLLDAVVQLAVQSVASAPPAEPEDGERYIVGTSPTGAFAGHANKVAAWQDGAWAFLTPRPGWRAWNVDAEELRVWSGDEWAALSAGGGGEGDVEGPDGGVADGDLALFDGTTGKAVKSGRGTISHLGIGAPFDDTDTDTSNRLVVKASRALFYAREDDETPGTGDIKLQISKEAEENSASFFFATNFSGRAEFGLVESDRFALKVSPDGSEWIEALSFDPATGAATFRRIAGMRAALASNLTLYVDGASGNDANDGLSPGAGAFATIQKAVDAAASLDLGIYAVTIDVAAGTYTAPVVLKSLAGAGHVAIVGDESTPSNVVVSTTSADCFGNGAFVGEYRIRGFRLSTTTGGNCINAQGSGARIQWRNVEFSACAASHIQATAQAWAAAEGNYSIIGNAARHLVVNGQSFISLSATTITLAGTPAFSAQFVLAATMGIANIPSGNVTFTGGATGARYSAISAGGIVVNTGAPNSFLPGNSNGSITSPGWVL